MRTIFKKRDEPFVYPVYYLWLQNRWACRMGALTSGLSKEKLIFLLMLFVVLTVSYLTYTICTAVSGTNSLIRNTAVISKVKPINEKNN